VDENESGFRFCIINLREFLMLRPAISAGYSLKEKGK
jgi:hypothetical protein